MNSTLPLLKRFYQSVEFRALTSNPNEHFEILLDDRAVVTPKKNKLRIKNRKIACLIVDEWKSQVNYIEPAKMPITRLLNSAIDVVGQNRDIILDDIVSYAGSDLLFYRTDSPEGLVKMQSNIWEPILIMSEKKIGHRFLRSNGVNYVEQPSEALKLLREFFSNMSDSSLAAIHLITTLTGSALLAFLISNKIISEETAWLAAHIDEDWQNSQWGIDQEAHMRRLNNEREFKAASLVLQTELF